MTTRVTYHLAGSIATITMDDDKVNALSLEMLGEINAALDQAVGDRAVVVLTGRDGILSAGFDLKVLGAGGPDAVDVRLGEPGVGDGARRRLVVQLERRLRVDPPAVRQRGPDEESRPW